MTAVLLTPLTGQFFDNNGDPLNGGLIYSYVAGTAFGTPLATYTDATGATPAANPVVLNSAGRADIWGAGTYDFKITDSLGNIIDTISSVTAIFGSGDMTKAVYDPANVAEQLAGLTAVQTMSNKTLTAPIFSAGTVSKAANVMTSGTNLTTPAAGSTEYDGKVQYFTPIGTQRGIVASPQTVILNGTVSGSDVNTAQSVFSVGCTLSSSTYYSFEGVYYFSKTAGTTSHTLSTLLGGTATYNLLSYSVEVNNNTTSLATLGAVSGSTIAVATAVAVTGAIASANSFVTVRIKGNASVNAGGTFIPQYQLSAAPGGAYTTSIGSWFRIWPVGASGASVNVGPWA